MISRIGKILYETSLQMKVEEVDLNFPLATNRAHIFSKLDFWQSLKMMKNILALMDRISMIIIRYKLFYKKANNYTFLFAVKEKWSILSTFSGQRRRTFQISSEFYIEKVFFYKGS